MCPSGSVHPAKLNIPLWLLIVAGLVVLGFAALAVSQWWSAAASPEMSSGITLVLAVLCAVSIGYCYPAGPAEETRPVAGSRARLICPVLIATLGVGLPLQPWLASQHVSPEKFRRFLTLGVFIAAVVSSGVVAGCVWRWWDRFDGRQRTWLVLACQWMLWPFVLPPLIYVGLLLLGTTPERAVELTGPQWVRVGPWQLAGYPITHFVPPLVVLRILVIVAGSLAATRMWLLGLMPAAAGMIIYWSSMVSWVYFVDLLGS